MDVATYFSKVMCRFLLICSEVRKSKILDKTGKFLLNYSNLFGCTFYPDTVYITVSASKTRVTHNLLWNMYFERKKQAELTALVVSSSVIYSLLVCYAMQQKQLSSFGVA